MERPKFRFAAGHLYTWLSDHKGPVGLPRPVRALRAAGFWLKGVPLVNPVEKEILVALRQLELAVKNATPADRSAELRKVFSRLDELTHELPADTDRDLLHYLHKKSYEKARLFLEGRGGENRRGQCTAA